VVSAGAASAPSPSTNGLRLAALLTIGLLTIAAPVHARTITLSAEDCDQMAILNAKVPRLGWAAVQANTGVYSAENQFQFFPDSTLLVRYRLDAIPKDQRITKAELTMPVEYVAGKPEISVRRLIADWGIGVCHLYRQTYPTKLEWAQPGGRGAATDRHNKDSAVFRIEKVGDHSVDVTEDVELWYTKAVANRGWVMAIENQSGPVYCPSPYSPRYNSGKRWKLQITFEPQ
jgi:hypothetical protein